MSRERTRGEAGFALALAVFALVVIGALVATAFFVARLEYRGGRNVLAATQAFEAAEAGLAVALEEWDPAAMDGLAPGAARLLPEGSLAGGVAWHRVRVTRLAGRLYLLSSAGERRGRDGRILARRQVGLVVRSDSAGVVPVARGWAQVYE